MAKEHNVNDMRILTSALALLLSATSAQAHPHVFVDAQGAYLFDEDGRLAGLQIYWLYDAFTTLLLHDTLELDPDGDGKLDEADLQRIAIGETDWPPEYEGDTYLWIDGRKQKLSRPFDASAHMIEDRVEVSFTLRLDAPVEMSGRLASLKIYDPAYYYAYAIPGEGRISGPATGCQLRINRFFANEQTQAVQEQLSQLSKEDIPDDPNIGAMFAEEIELQCD